jgi:hypothetical protein
MAHVNFNHLNAKAFNSFVPEATIAANNEIFEKLVIIGGIAFFGWFVYQTIQENNTKIIKRIE